jgi:hypothetical protein
MPVRCATNGRNAVPGAQYPLVDLLDEFLGDSPVSGHLQSTQSVLRATLESVSCHESNHYRSYRSIKASKVSYATRDGS